METDYEEPFTKIPIIDLSYHPLQKAKLINDLRETCHRVGFFYVKNHGITLLTKIIAECRQFFNLPSTEKQMIHNRHSEAFRGYSSVGDEKTNEKPDIKESFDVGPEIFDDSRQENEKRGKDEDDYMVLQGPNQWPSSLPHFRTRMIQYCTEMQNLGRSLMRLLAEALDLSEDHFDDAFVDNNYQYFLLRLSAYPSTSSSTNGENQPQGIGAHTDFGWLTLLAQDQIGGLEIQNTAGEWIEARPIENHLIVNLGDMLQLWSDNYFLATPHRVINRSQSRTRHSVVFFMEPNLNFIIRPIRLGNEEFKGVKKRDSLSSLDPDVTEIVYGEHMLKAFKRSYPTLGKDI